MNQPAAQNSAPSSSFAAAKRHRTELFQTIQAFEAALAIPAREPRWRTQVAKRAQRLREAFAEHIVVTEGPNGLYAELLEHAPRLVHGVTGLVREHASLLADVDAFIARIETADIERLRRRANQLLRALGRHRQRGADLVYEAYETDIGGET